MLDLAGLPVLAHERDATMPLVIAGGSCTHNPEPMADFVDLFVIGEGEEVLLELLEAVRLWKAGAKLGHARAAAESVLLQRLARIAGVYVPSLYRVSYRSDGMLAALDPLQAGAARAGAQAHPAAAGAGAHAAHRPGDGDRP